MVAFGLANTNPKRNILCCPKTCTLNQPPGNCVPFKPGRSASFATSRLSKAQTGRHTPVTERTRGFSAELPMKPSAAVYERTSNTCKNTERRRTAQHETECSVHRAALAKTSRRSTRCLPAALAPLRIVFCLASRLPRLTPCWLHSLGSLYAKCTRHRLLSFPVTRSSERARPVQRKLAQPNVN